MKAALYVRVSTLDQNTENQAIELRRYIESRGWTAVEYRDHGVSGAKERRPALDQLVADHAPITATAGHDVIRDQMLRLRHDPRRELPGGHGFDGPGPRRLDRVKIRAIEADNAQQVGERVHGRVNLVPFQLDETEGVPGRELHPRTQAPSRTRRR